MSLRSATMKYGIFDEVDEPIPIKDVLVNYKGYSRNFAIEENLRQNLKDVRKHDKEWKSGLNPARLKVPSWWDRNPMATGIYGWEEDGYTPEEAIAYLEAGIEILEAKYYDAEYRCHNYPRDTHFCQNTTQFGGEINKSRRMIAEIKEVIKYEQQKAKTAQESIILNHSTPTPIQDPPKFQILETPQIDTSLEPKTPQPKSESIVFPSLIPIMIGVVVLIGVLLFLRRRA